MLNCGSIELGPVKSINLHVEYGMLWHTIDVELYRELTEEETHVIRNNYKSEWTYTDPYSNKIEKFYAENIAIDIQNDLLAAGMLNEMGRNGYEYFSLLPYIQRARLTRLTFKMLPIRDVPLVKESVINFLSSFDHLIIDEEF